MIRKIARPLLASVFIHSGYRTLVDPGPAARAAEPLLTTAEPVVENVAANVPGVSAQQVDRRTLTRVYGGTQLTAALLLATGRLPRTASLVLAGSMIPAASTHAFWNEDDPHKRQQLTVQFLRDLSLTGGLIIAGFDTEGQPGAVWRAKRTARKLSAAVPGLPTPHGDHERLLEHAAAAKGAARHAGEAIAANATTAGERLSHAVEQATPVVTDAASRAADKSSEWISQATPVVTDAASRAADKSSEWLSHAVEQAKPVVSEAASRAADKSSEAGSTLADKAATAGKLIAPVPVTAAIGVRKSLRRRHH